MVKELKYIILEYNDKDLEYIDKIFKEIDSKSQEIIDFFEIDKFGNKVNIKIFSDVNEFRRFHKKVFWI